MIANQNASFCWWTGAPYNKECGTVLGSRHTHYAGVTVWCSSSRQGSISICGGLAQRPSEVHTVDWVNIQGRPGFPFGSGQGELTDVKGLTESCSSFPLKNFIYWKYSEGKYLTSQHSAPWNVPVSLCVGRMSNFWNYSTHSPIGNVVLLRAAQEFLLCSQSNSYALWCRNCCGGSRGRGVWMVQQNPFFRFTLACPKNPENGISDVLDFNTFPGELAPRPPRLLHLRHSQIRTPPPLPLKLSWNIC